ncbi:MAG TPA: aldo/keto reductase [Stellaceae bacterium]|jgi:aryl-alcohol dehydrogenase-like predicted oxidoreductase|nr:aldo/keto reductase [Stellaceae bacterium]
MKYRMLGRTGLYVSEICFGTMTFAGTGMFKNVGQVDQDGATALVKQALDAGVNFIDTADVYSQGDSERYLGEALKRIGVPRSDVVIATKVRGRMGPGANSVGLTRGHIMDAVEASLKRLQTDHIDLYQIHGQDAVTPLDETMGALDNLVKRGLVRYIGCSNLAAWQIEKCLGLSALHGWARFETVQAFYTIASRDLEREILPMMDAEQMGLMVWSPLAGGLLSGKFERDRAGPNNARRSSGFDFPPMDKSRTFDIVDAMRPIADKHKVSVARVALAWLLSRKNVMSVIVGAKTEEQLRDNLAAPTLTLDAAELASLDEVSKLKPEYPIWMFERQGQGRVPEGK